MSDKILNNIIKFIKSVESNECIWNEKIPERNKRCEIKKAWKKIANEFNESVPIVRERWRNIRNTFLRSIKKGPCANKIKKYYLADYLKFLLPHIRINLKLDITSSLFDDQKEITSSSNAKENPIEKNANDNEAYLMHSNQAEIISEEVTQYQITNIKHFPITLKHQERKQKEKEQESKQIKVQLQQNCGSHITSEYRNDIRSRKRKNADNEEIEIISIIKEKDRENKDREDANFYFLKSLLPDLNTMNPSQNRQFRQKVLALIDNILSNKHPIELPSQVSASATGHDYTIESNVSQVHFQNLRNNFVKDELCN